MSGSNDLLGDLVAEAQRGARGETGALVLLERETEMRNLSKKAKTIIAGAAIAGLASTGVAYAYWTTTGTGTGTAAVGTSSEVTITGTSDSVALTPGGPASVITFSVNNPSTGFQTITTVHLVSVAAFPTALDRTDGTNVISGCGTADFAMTDVTSGQNVAPGVTTLTAFGGLTMNNLPTPQNACKGAFLKLTLSSS